MNAELQFNRPDSQSLLEENRSQITWSDVSRFLKLYWPLICGIFLSTVITTYLAVSFLTDRYMVTAKLLVRVGREQLEPPPTVRDNSTLSSLGLRKEEVTSEIQILQSPDLITQVVDTVGVEHFRLKPTPPIGLLGNIKFYLKQSVRKLKELGNEILIVLGLTKRLDDREQAISWLLRGVEVAPERESDVIGVYFRTPDPAGGIQILEKWISLYLQRRLQVRQNTGVQEFLGEGVKEARERLAQAEQQKLHWKQSWSLGEGPEQMALLLNQISDLSADHSSTLREVEALGRERETAKSLIVAGQRNLPVRRQENPNPVRLKLRDELTSLQLQRSKLLTTFRPQTTSVQNLDEQITRVAYLIEQEERTQIFATYELNPLMTSLEQKFQEYSIQLEGLKARAQQQQQRRESLEAELRSLAEAGAKLGELERERLIAEQRYFAVVKRKQEADIAAELDFQRISNISVLTPPVSSIQPVYPRRLMMLGVSVVLGLLFGLGWSLLLQYLDDRVRGPAQLTDITGLAHLGTLSSSHISTPDLVRP